MSNLSQILADSNWGQESARINQNFQNINTDLEKVKSSTTKFKGYFTTEESLKNKFGSPKEGDTAWVGEPYPGTVYDVQTDGQWHNTGKAPDTGSVDLQDYAKKAELTELEGKVGGVGYVTCDTAAGTAAKVITVTGLTVLSTGIRLLVKMTNNNTASNATLNINGLGAKPLYYNNTRVSGDNTWEAGEIVDIYYDGTNFYSGNFQGGSSESGNLILEWNTDASTTRKQVKQSDRKSLLQISYKNGDGETINEQYEGLSVTDEEWSNDSNWNKILNFSETVIDNNTGSSSNPLTFDIYEGYGFVQSSEPKLDVYSSMSVKVYKIRQGVKYTLDNIIIDGSGSGSSYLKKFSFAKKIGNSGTGDDFQFLLPTELCCKSPYVGLGGISLSNTGVGSLDNSQLIINPIYIKNEESEQLYLIVGYKFNNIYNNAKLFEGSITSSDITFNKVYSLKIGETIDNYEYIKKSACEFEEISSKNLFIKDNITSNYGVIYKTEGELNLNKLYSCAYIPLKFDTYYTVSGYKWSELGGAHGGNNICLVCEKKEIVENLKITNFIEGNTWLSTDDFFTKTDNIYKEAITNDVFTFKTPKESELNVSKIGVVINILYSNKPSDISNILQVEEGTSPTDYVEGGKLYKLTKIFGYDFFHKDSESSNFRSSIFNQLYNQTMFFFGDSITQGTDGGYVDLIKDKLKLAVAYNYGKANATTSTLVDIMTGLGIREQDASTPPDYNKCKAICIQIGTNGNVDGDINKDIPNISIYDITAYPYIYNNPNGTITEATVNNEEDYFKKLFPNTFYANLALCIEWVLWKNPNCKIWLITIPPNNRKNYIQTREALIKIGELYSIPVIDAQANSGISFRNITKWSKDNIHFNLIGNELWASYIARELSIRYYDTNVVVE